LTRPKRQCNTTTRRNRWASRPGGSSSSRVPARECSCNGATGPNRGEGCAECAGGERKDRRRPRVRERRTTKGSRFFEPTVPTVVRRRECNTSEQATRATTSPIARSCNRTLTRRRLSDRAKRLSEMRGRAANPTSRCEQRDEREREPQERRGRRAPEREGED
jgi:hypothetical protein